MRLLSAVVFAFLSSTLAARAQQLSIANITTCGLTCLLQTVPRAGCGLADSACQCSSTILTDLTTACLLANCTMHDTLALAKVQAVTCSLPHDDRTHLPIAVTIAIVTLTAIFVLLRLVSKAWVSNTLGIDDWIIAAALICSFPSAYYTVKMSRIGFGRHVWDLNDGDLFNILRDFYISENFYVWDLALTKISVLVFYLRIFPQRWFSTAAFGTMALIAISTFIISFMTIFSCNPVPFFWDRDLRGTCINVNALAYANSGMSIVQDVIIVIIPIPVLAHLNMGLKKKIAIGFMFVIGGFGCIISMIRLKSLLAFGNSLDPTWDYVDAVIWTTLELAVAMICACLPAIRNLLIKLYPAAFLTSMRSSDGTRNLSGAGHPAGSGSGPGLWGSRGSRSQKGRKGEVGGGFVQLERTRTASSSRKGEEGEEVAVLRHGGGEEDDWAEGKSSRPLRPLSGV